MSMNLPAAPPPFLGQVEPLAGRLRTPPAGQRLYKIMKVEHLLSSFQGGYLHFNRVDAYRDFAAADTADGAELSSDHAGNAAAYFEKVPDFSLSDLCARARSRAYACCLSLENSSEIWASYAKGSQRGQIGVVFDFGKLRQRLNSTLQQGQSRLMIGDIACHQLFSINYGIVDYVDRIAHRANLERAANPLDYIYLKDQAYQAEQELRISLSASGMGHPVLADGAFLEFPEKLALEFSFQEAFADGTIIELLACETTDSAYLAAELAKLGALVQGTSVLETPAR